MENTQENAEEVKEDIIKDCEDCDEGDNDNEFHLVNDDAKLK